MNKLVPIGRWLPLAVAALSFSAQAEWYDNPDVKATVDVGYAGTTDPHYLNKSADDLYLAGSLGTAYGTPFKVWRIIDLLAKEGATPDCGYRLITRGKDPSWKGGAINHTHVIPAPGPSSEATIALNIVPGYSHGLSFGGTQFDGLAFGTVGSFLYSNDLTAKNRLHRWAYPSLETGGSCTDTPFDGSALTRIRNVSVYNVGGRDVLFYGEGSSSAATKGRVCAIDTSAATWTETTIVTTALNGDITNVKLSGMSTETPSLYVLTDAGELAIYTLNADCLTGATLVKTLTPGEVAALCGLSATPTTGKFRNFEVTGGGGYAFFLYGTAADSYNPDGKTMLTVVESKTIAASTPSNGIAMDTRSFVDGFCQLQKFKSIPPTGVTIIVR